MVVSKPEPVLHPHSDEAHAIFPKRMHDHFLDAVGCAELHTKDIDPCARAGQKEVCTERGRAESAGSQHEELACRKGQRRRGDAGKGEVGLG